MKNLKPRAVLSAVAMAILCSACSSALAQPASEPDSTPSPNRPFRLWASSCSHVDKDIAPREGQPRESLAEAIRQSEGFNNDGAPSFEWDVALHLGDFAATQGFPDDELGHEVIRQFASLRKHRREQFYCVAGNHDGSGPGEPTQWWFRKWIDPIGESTAFSGVDATRRSYRVTGTWERYSFQVGNVLFLMMCDRNDGGPPAGRGERGGYPAGAVSGETFEWWKQMVEANQDKIIISTHHHMLRETTVASGPWEGVGRDDQGNVVGTGRVYHGYFSDGAPKGASYLYFVDGKPDAQAFEGYLAAHPGAIDLWLGGHTHTRPDDVLNGRSHIEQKWGVTFVNCAAMTLYHARSRSPMSRLLTLTPDSRDVKIQCYLHSDDVAARGWYEPAERVVQLNKSFGWEP